jgi:hypothetical protein
MVIYLKKTRNFWVLPADNTNGEFSACVAALSLYTRPPIVQKGEAKQHE